MSDSRISIGYLDKENIQLDLNRTEGTETISLDDFCTLIERHQWLLEEAFEQAREKRIDRDHEHYNHINDAVPYMTNNRHSDPFTNYMMSLIDKNERDAGL